MPLINKTTDKTKQFACQECQENAAVLELDNRSLCEDCANAELIGDDEVIDEELLDD